MNFDEAADAYWFDDEVRSSGPLEDSRKRTFESLLNAIKFVMKELQGSARTSAWIATPSHHFDIEEIGTIYDSEEFKNASL